MATKTGMGYSSLTDKIYWGKQNTEKRMWVGLKRDITNDFIDMSFTYFKENKVRVIGSDGVENLFINVKNDKKGLERVIKKLTKRLDSMNKKVKPKVKSLNK